MDNRFDIGKLENFLAQFVERKKECEEHGHKPFYFPYTIPTEAVILIQ
ncbi:hypothetical protein KY312_00075 [Candidatus Woesearchaeota archaeon]|nr:hypothetical protein [Candidatus Woesearchaeota archaeon]